MIFGSWFYIFSELGVLMLENIGLLWYFYGNKHSSSKKIKVIENK
jgi:hypothetical protein